MKSVGRKTMRVLTFRVTLVVLFFLCCGWASAAVRISQLPPPPPTAKLRVFVVAVTTEFKSAKGPVFWPVSPEEFDRIQKKAIGERLRQQGIYEVVADSDLRAVLGTQKPAGWEWLADDCRLVREVGRALHADYALVSERSFAIHLQFDTRLMNLHSGKEFAAEGYVPSTMLRAMNKEQKTLAGGEAVKIQFRQIFQEARGDLMRTAVRKGKIATKGSGRDEKTVPPPLEEKAAAGSQPLEKGLQAAQASKDKAPAATLQKTPPPPAAVEKQRAFEKELERALNPGDQKKAGPRLIVYDFEASEPMKVAGLILTEALREALHHSGNFVLIQRENMLKFLEEYKLQQSGLVDKKQAVRAAKWLAASEAVTGNLAVLGNTSLLQAKRMDIETLGTLAAGSIKCPAGREDELLERMPELAAMLTGGKK